MIIHPNFDPVAIRIGDFAIHWYGISYLMAFGLGIILGRYRARRPNSGWQPDEIYDLVYVIFLGVILGGRLGYVIFYNLSYYLQNPLGIFKVWDGGMSFHGGFIGVLVAMYVYARQTNRHFLQVADYLALLSPLGIGVVRVANFINQELWGRVTDVPWAVQFHTIAGARHPSQLYEALSEGLLLFALVWIYAAKPRDMGRVAGFFCWGYGTFRFICEFFREPDAHLGAIISWLTMGQVLSVPMILIGAWLWLRPLSVNKQTKVTG